MLRIIKLFSLLFVLITCTIESANAKIYRTTVCPNDGLQVFSDVDRLDKISSIPFKSKVQIIDNIKIISKLSHDEYIKIKYKDTTGYVLAEYLSEKDEIPFVENIKYDFNLNEFQYDKGSIINAVKKRMQEEEYFKGTIPYFYVDDLQIFTLYGKDCNGLKVKRIVVIMISKLHKNFNEIICFEIENGKLVFYGGGGFGNDTIQEVIHRFKLPDEHCDERCDGECE